MMQVLRGLRAPPPPRPTVVTVGKFTVVHRGHRALLRRVLETAERLGAAPAAVTFDRHPLEVLAPERAPRCQLATLRQRMEQFAEVGLELVLLVDFTPQLAALEPEAFVEQAVVRTLRARAVVVGEDFRFGHQRRGDVELLRELGRRHGFSVETIPLVRVNGDEVSSTAIRRLVLEGRVDEAARLWGQAFRIPGTVVEGAGRGRGLGFPTANLRPDPGLCLPAFGVYAGWWRWRGRRLAGAINVGLTPTFPDVTEPKIEVHILDFEGELYGERGEIELVRRLRPEQRFASVGELAERIRQDVAEVRALLASEVPGPPAGGRV